MATICKTNSDVCQIRLDFNTFVISGPSTTTTSIGEVIFGAFVTDGVGADVAEAGQCLTDTFAISNQIAVPTICGTNTNAHGTYLKPASQIILHQLSNLI